MKPFSDECKVCHRKIDAVNDNWADIGPPEKPNATVHMECIGFGPVLDHIQDEINKKFGRVGKK